ncbi:hypothetical protein QZH41_019861 [Actinostola sp. cb2023]|nr:hypothetical protein QZH41_019861 [Actinostola sp. cb2023]
MAKPVSKLGIGDSAFAELIQSSFLHSKPKFRPKLITLLEDDFFRNDYLDVVSFLSNITIKSDIDKDKFFSSLASKLRNISSTVVATRLLPKLMSRFVMAEPSAEKEFLPHLLTPDTGKLCMYSTVCTVMYTAVIQNESVFPILPLDLFKFIRFFFSTLTLIVSILFFRLPSNQICQQAFVSYKCFVNSDFRQPVRECFESSRGSDIEVVSVV